MVWLITGAARRMGVEFAKAALVAGDAVVATGRDPGAVATAVGEADDLLAAKLDVTSRADAEASVQAAVDRFGRIDVLVNNAGNFYAGYFEELTPAQVDAQLAVTLLGPMNVTRAVLPAMRRQRSGHTISNSSGRASQASNTTVRMPRRSSASSAGWSRCSRRSRRSGSARRSSTRASTAPSC